MSAKINKPVPTLPGASNQPLIPSNLKTSHSLSFSFKYFKQIEYFGLDGVSSSWCVSLLERFQSFCSLDKDYNLKSKTGRQALRYHEIDWDSKNIPISQENINWVDKKYINNAEEFPFMQFHVSKGSGRVIGFWDESGLVFNIVLLDPMHNMQPSSYNDYKVRDSDPISSDYNSLLCDIDNLKNSKHCSVQSCKMISALNNVPTKANDTNLISISLDDSYTRELSSIIASGKTLKEVIEMGILHSG